MKSLNIFSSFVAIVLSAQICKAQVGRHELPRDTTPIGGRQQIEKTNSMEGRDDLMKQLVSLRDSINVQLNSLNNEGSDITDVNKQRNSEGAQVLTKYKSELDGLIDKVKGKDKMDTEVTRKAYQKLHEIRARMTILNAKNKE